VAQAASYLACVVDDYLKHPHPLIIDVEKIGWIGDWVLVGLGVGDI
jgi:hypothetical protein